ncbi:hypothetical protein F9L07_28555 [Pimelobacter simplex]|uniref:Terminase small subunit n=1 Tax=Nocardioides simplex TaxID=2045 RepID=A0A7J5DQR0_NOCSI|nr:hypothetical protein [Pimelobacter simplex]KAB2806986.1 hypothetical protein F9L07_28555 [Pimelobacter simplex]
MPARKKDPSVRARRNKTAGRATLRRVPENTTNAEAYGSMTLVQLREAIDVVNAGRPADAQLPKRGAKAALVEMLVAAERQIPDMPAHPPRFVGEGEDSYEVDVDWHPQTEAWWNEVWTSPMASEWDDSDRHNLFVLALLYDDIWTASTPKMRKEAMAEFRLQRADLGLSPYSRRRLEWTIESADEAKDRGEQRRQRRAESHRPASKAAAGAEDPRNILRSVK